MKGKDAVKSGAREALGAGEEEVGVDQEAGEVGGSTNRFSVGALIHFFTA